MKKYFLLTIQFVLIQSFCFTQQLEWAKSIGSKDLDEMYSFVLDDQGNTYATGYFFDTVDFDPGPGEDIHISHWHDIFIMKMDASGNLVWAKTIGGINGDIGNSIVLDKSGYLYVTGSFTETVDFDPGSGTYNLSTTEQQPNVFILKLDLSGNFIWAKSFGSNGADSGNIIKLDSDGNIIISGYFGVFATNSMDLDPGANSFNITGGGDYNSFYVKLDPSGNFIWGGSFVGPKQNVINGMQIDQNNNVYFGGYFMETTNFDPNHSDTQKTSTGNEDIFILKLNSAGAFQWVKTMGSSQYDNLYDLEFDKDDNLYACGFFNETMDVDLGAGVHNITSAGQSDGFVLKLTSDGDFQSCQQYGSTSYDAVSSITFDELNNSYILGTFSGTIDVDPGASVFNLNSSKGVFFTRLSPEGNLIGGFHLDGNIYTYCNLVDNENFYVAGRYYDTIDFDPGSTTSNLTSVAGSSDIFIAKYNRAFDLISAVTTTKSQIAFEIFPNPAKGKFTIQLTERITDVGYEIYNSTGKLVQSGNATEAATIAAEINGPSGIYFVRIYDGEGHEGFVKVINE